MFVTFSWTVWHGHHCAGFQNIHQEGIVAEFGHMQLASVGMVYDAVLQLVLYGKMV